MSAKNNAMVYEEDIELAADLAKYILGPNGRIVSSSNREWVPNAVLETKEHGKLWYGDLELEIDGGKVQKLADELKTTVLVFNQDRTGRFAGCEAAFEGRVATNV